VHDLDEDQWTRWLPVLLTFLREGTKKFADRLLGLAYAKVPDTLLTWLVQRVLSEGESLHLSVIANIEHIWDNRISDTLSELLRPELLPAQGFVLLAEQLLKRGNDRALTTCLNILREYHSTHAHPQLARGCAEVLIANSPRSCWDLLWSLFQKDV